MCANAISRGGASPLQSALKYSSISVAAITSRKTNAVLVCIPGRAANLSVRMSAPRRAHSVGSCAPFVAAAAEARASKKCAAQEVHTAAVVLLLAHGKYGNCRRRRDTVNEHQRLRNISVGENADKKVIITFTTGWKIDCFPCLFKWAVGCGDIYSWIYVL